MNKKAVGSMEERFRLRFERRCFPIDILQEFSIVIGETARAASVFLSRQLEGIKKGKEHTSWFNIVILRVTSSFERREE